MPYEMRIEASFPVSDNPREQARMIAAIDKQAGVFEEAIRQASGFSDVALKIRAIRRKDPAPPETTVTPLRTTAAE